MNQNLTEIVFILDRSGSMEGLEKDTIGGFNGFVKKQAQTGQTILTTVLFDDKYEIIHNGINAEHAVLTDREYFTRGSTALLDALGKTIGNVGNRLNETPEASKPGKVIFVITTDGLENASREFSYSEIQKMINHQKQKYNWEFIFLGANIDVAEESKKLGIASDRALCYTASETGVTEMFNESHKMCKSIRQYNPDKIHV